MIDALINGYSYRLVNHAPVDVGGTTLHNLEGPIKQEYPVFFSFMEELRTAGIPASLKEHLALLEALDADVIQQNP